MAESQSNTRGFVHNLSPVKRSRNQNQWFEFNLQTSPTKVKRVAGFNIASHCQLQEHEESKTAVVLKTHKRKQRPLYYIQPAVKCQGCTSI